MSHQTEGQGAFENDVALALRLLNKGYTPEEVEEHFAARPATNGGFSALTDPNNNPQFKEVTDHGTAEGTG